MRGKRSKQYRKLMQQYELSFGFRNPYQVLLDSDIIRDADKFKMDLIGGLERTLHGEVKPMITQCCMRHLYAASSEPGVSYLIDKAKLYERRRCGHLPTEYPEPLSAKECIDSVVDPKGSGTNKHRYVVASQELEVRKAMRGLKGVPLVYINRSVMIMEPMADATAGVREREERAKFRDGLKSSGGRESGSQGMKRKREDGEEAGDRAAATEKKKKAKFGKGVKGPNPLAVKKPKMKVEDEGTAAKQPKQPKSGKDENISGPQESSLVDGQENEASDPNTKKKRKRKHKSAKEGAVGAVADADAGAQSAEELI